MAAPRLITFFKSIYHVIVFMIKVLLNSIKYQIVNIIIIELHCLQEEKKSIDGFYWAFYCHLQIGEIELTLGCFSFLFANM